MCDYHGMTFMAQFDFVRQCFAPRCNKSFSEACFVDFLSWPLFSKQALISFERFHVGAKPSHFG